MKVLKKLDGRFISAYQRSSNHRDSHSMNLWQCYLFINKRFKSCVMSKVSQDHVTYRRSKAMDNDTNQIHFPTTLNWMQVFWYSCLIWRERRTFLHPSRTTSYISSIWTEIRCRFLKQASIWIYYDKDQTSLYLWELFEGFTISYQCYYRRW